MLDYVQVDTLAELKGTAISSRGILYSGSLFIWKTDGAPYRPDERNIVASDYAVPSVGAWVRQDLPPSAFVQNAEGALPRTISDKLGEIVSVLDFIPQDEHSRIRSGNSHFDCAEAFQRAIDEFWTVVVPDGTYLIGTTIREASDGGARSLIGQSRLHTRIVATAGLATRGDPLFWFGNSSAHGNYRLRFEHMSLNGAGEATSGTGGAIGIRAQECGTSYIGNLYIYRCAIAIDAIGCIGSSFGGEQSEVIGCQRGVWFSVPTAGSPRGADDIATTSSPLSLKDNANRVKNFWLSKVARPVRLMGGLTHVDHLVLQNCGNGASDDLIHLLEANESYDYGGGPALTNIWCEGGTYRSIVRIEHTRDASVRKMFLSGPGPAGEQGIVVLSSKGCRVDDVAARGTWSGPPSEGRNGNYWLYVDAASPNGVFGPFYFTQNSCSYFVDRRSPRHNHIIIDNHRADNSTNGVIIGPIQISGNSIGKDPAAPSDMTLYMRDFVFSGKASARGASNELGVFDSEHEFRINSQRVVGARQPAIANATNGKTIDVEARKAINSMLAALRKHGLIES